MSNNAQPKRKKNTTDDVVNDTAVINFLRNTPDFFVTYPKLLEELEMPGDDTEKTENVTSLAAFQARKLEQKLERLEERNRLLIQTSMDNMESLQAIQQLSIDLLKAGSLTSLKRTLSQRLKKELALDSARLWLSPTWDAKAPNLLEHDTTSLFEKGETVRLSTVYPAHPHQLHETKMAGSIASEALIRLHDGRGKLIGLLALGSQDPARFHPGQGTDLLVFLGDVLGFCLSQLQKQEAATPSAS